MGLPASGPLSTGPAPITAPRFGKPALSSPPSHPSAGPTKTDAADPAMTFKLVSSGGVSCCKWIAADGAITSATPQVFKNFRTKLGQDAPTLQLRVTFNSPGGDFFAALALGREIRRDTRMWTAVGRTEALPSTGDGAPKAYQVGEGVCLSACVLAFMGGKTRVYGPEGGPGARGLAIISMAFDQPASVIGRPSAEAMAAAGLPASGMLRLAMEGYAVEMGVDPSIAAVVKTASQPGGMHAFTPDEANRLGLVTPLVPRTKWALTVVRGGLALYGAGEDRWTSYKTSLKCIGQERGRLEYSITVPIDLGTRSTARVEEDYRRGIQRVKLTDPRGESTPARLVGIQVIPDQSLPTTVPRRLLLTTWLDEAQVEIMRREGTSVRFEVPHSLEGVIPEVALDAHQVTDAVGLLLRNCPSD